MNELQVSLLVIGGVIVAAVYGFNRWQEKKLKNRAEELFQSDHDDVLLDEAPTISDEPSPVFHNEPSPILHDEPSGRIEPVLGGEPAFSSDDTIHNEELPVEPVFEPKPAPAAPREMVVPGLIDYTARLHADTPAAAGSLEGVMRAAAGFGKPVMWRGLNSRSGAWEDLSRVGPEETYTEFEAALQLVGRQGAAAAHELEMFCDAIQNGAADLSLTADCPDIQPAADHASALDKLCADADVLIGINVVPANGTAIPATKVRAFAEAAGMKLADDGAFYFRTDEGVALYSLCNLDPDPFTPESIKTLSTHGVTLLLDVPKTPNGLRVFDQMLSQARQMANTLGGLVVDDNRRPFTDAGADGIRGQLKDIYRRMDEMQVPSGGEQAARLFS